MAGNLFSEGKAVELISLAVSGAITRDPKINQQEFGEIVARLTSRSDVIGNVAAAPDLVVSLTYPYEQNAGIIGLDYTQLPDQLLSVRKAMETKSPVFDGPLQLVQGMVGFIARVPIFIESADNTSKNPWGIISVVIDANKLFALAGLNAPKNQARIAIRNVDQFGPRGRIVFGEASTFSMSPVLRTIPFPGGDWELGIVPIGGWPVSTPNRYMIWFLGALSAAILIVLIERLHRLRTQRERARQQLRMAISSVGGGFAYFDSDYLLVEANDTYKSLAGTMNDPCKEGDTFESLLRKRVKEGLYQDAAGQDEECISERIAQHLNPVAPFEQMQPDGRWFNISESKTPDGGIVTICTDITELKCAKDAARAADQAKPTSLIMSATNCAHL